VAISEGMAAAKVAAAFDFFLSFVEEFSLLTVVVVVFSASTGPVVLAVAAALNAAIVAS
jgi:hypothetical protein